MSIPSDLYERIKGLDQADRAELAEFLLLSLEPGGRSDPDLDAAWAREIEDRARAVEEGREPLLPWEEVRARLRGIAPNQEPR